MEHLPRLPYLVLETAKEKRYQSLGERPYWTIGRSQDNDIVIAEHSISRRHALLQVTATGEFNLMDLGSLNGTWVNERRLSVAVTLKNGDRIWWGNCYGEFYSASASEIDSQVEAEEEEEMATAFLRQRQLVSVVVVGLRNFTVLAQKMESEMLSQLMSHWFRKVENIFSQAESSGNKSLGDGLIALWSHGQEEAEEGTSVVGKQVLKILQAVRAVNQLTTQLNQKYQSSLAFPLEVGVGINTGLAIVGNMGSESLPDSTTMGDTVKVAFDLESATKETGADLLMGEGSYRHLLGIKKVRELFSPYPIILKKDKELETIAYGTTRDKLEEFSWQSSMLASQADISRKMTVRVPRTDLPQQKKQD